MSQALINYLAKLFKSGDVAVTLTGRIPEYSWFDGDMEPTPTEEFAFGVKFNTSTGAITVYGWSGTAWVGVA